MAKSAKSLRGIICYSICMCVAFCILSYSSYRFFTSDEAVKTSEANSTIFVEEEDIKNSDTLVIKATVETVLDKKEEKEVPSAHLSDTDAAIPQDEELSQNKKLSQDEELSQDELYANVLESMKLRDADIISQTDADVVIYAADKVVEYEDFYAQDDASEEDSILEEESVLCPEDEIADGGDASTDGGEFCVPAHGENSFDVTPEYIDEVDPSAPREPIYIRDKVRSGDTAGKILNKWLSPAEIHELIQTTNKHYKLSNIRVGRPYTVTLDPYDNSFQHFMYEIDNTKVLYVHLDKSKATDGKVFVAEVSGILYDYKLVKVHGSVDNSLYGAVIGAGENTALGALLTDIFGWEVDFVRDIRHGDSFSVLVEKRYRDGEFKGYGRVLYATYINDGELHEAFRFTAEPGISTYFDRDGRSLRKAFLKAPLNYTRISSPYTMKRWHPILKKNRPHQGIDYAAPTGTPVKSVGDGKVVFRGWMNGYGYIVRVRHANNIETMYAHLSKFAKGLKVNSRVRQGEVIAYVGSTGLSTGPHLDFRVRKNGQFVNPNTLLNPRSEPVPKNMMGAFRERIKLYEQLEKDAGTGSYLPELVLEK